MPKVAAMQTLPPQVAILALILPALIPNQEVILADLMAADLMAADLTFRSYYVKLDDS
jgi:hypothetical protein